MMVDEEHLKALPWALFGPFFGALGVAHLLRGRKEAARLRFLLSGATVVMMLIIFATVDPFSGPDPTVIILTALSVYALVWLLDLGALMKEVLEASTVRRPILLAVLVPVGLVGFAWIAGWLTMWLLQGLPSTWLMAWLVLPISMAALVPFFLVVGGKPGAGQRRIWWRLLALWLGGQVGALGAAAVLDRDRDAALGWSLVGITLGAFVFLSGAAAIREVGQVNGLFGLTSSLYLLLWASIAARTVIAANADGTAPAAGSAGSPGPAVTAPVGASRGERTPATASRASASSPPPPRNP